LSKWSFREASKVYCKTLLTFGLVAILFTVHQSAIYPPFFAVVGCEIAHCSNFFQEGVALLVIKESER
jgi:hypothetical protein